MDTTTADTPRRLGARGEKTRTELKNAARTVFARIGYLNATVPDIAQQASKSPAAFYKYFDNKRDVLEVLLYDFLEDFTTSTKILGTPDLSRYEDLYRAVESFWNAYMEYRVEWVGAIHASAVDTEFLATWLRLRDIGVQRIAHFVKTAQANGHFPQDQDSVVTASNLSAMLEHSCYLWAGIQASSLGQPTDPAEAISSIATLWHRSIWAPGNQK